MNYSVPKVGQGDINLKPEESLDKPKNEVATLDKDVQNSLQITTTTLPKCYHEPIPASISISNDTLCTCGVSIIKCEIDANKTGANTSTLLGKGPFRPPIPYSTLLLSDPTELIKQLGPNPNNSCHENALRLTLRSNPILKKDLGQLRIPNSKSVESLKFTEKKRNASISKYKRKLSRLTGTNSGHCRNLLGYEVVSNGTGNVEIEPSTKTTPTGLVKPESDTPETIQTIEAIETNETIQTTQAIDEPKGEPILADPISKPKLQNYIDLLDLRLIALLYKAKLILTKKTNRTNSNEGNQHLIESVSILNQIEESGESPSLSFKDEELQALEISTALNLKCIPNFCDTTSPDNPNVEAVDTMLEQLGCMYRHMIVNASTISSDCTHFEGHVNNLQEKLVCYEQTKDALERDLTALQNELANCQSCLEEETQKRMSLECLIAQLRGEINEIDQQLCIVGAENNQLRECVEDLRRQQEQCRESYQQLQQERDELHRSNIITQQDMGKKGFGNMQTALAECCAKVDALTLEMGRLQAEVNRVTRDKCDLELERDELQRKLDRDRQKCAAEKSLTDEIIQKLKDEIKCLQNQQQNSCQKFKSALNFHHIELDRLDEEREKFQKMYEDEKRLKEELEKRLKDCEENKARRAQEPIVQSVQFQQSQQFQQSTIFQSQQTQQFHQQITQLNSNCEQYKADIERLEQEGRDLHICRQCLELQVQTLEQEKVFIAKELEDAKDRLHSIEQAAYQRKMLGLYEEKLRNTEMLKSSLEQRIREISDRLSSSDINNNLIEEEAEQLRQQLADIHFEEVEIEVNPSVVLEDRREMRVTFSDPFVSGSTGTEDNNNNFYN